MSAAAGDKEHSDTVTRLEDLPIWKHPFPDYLESPLSLPPEYSKQARLKLYRFAMLVGLRENR